MELSNRAIEQLNGFESFLSFKRTWIGDQLLLCRHSTIGAFTGNQWGKTANFAYGYVLRSIGWHPIAEKNVLYFKCPNGHKFVVDGNPYARWIKGVETRPLDNICPHCNELIQIHERTTRTFRFASETLPGEKGDKASGGETAEIKNTIYPAFKKWLPLSLIKKDITFRNPAMRLHDPYQGMTFTGKEDLYYKGGDIIVEYVSFNQDVQAQAGVQRLSVWCDEEPRIDFAEEQYPRLIAEDGDFLISLTPANRVTWTYDSIFERASVYIRSKTVCDFIEQDTGERPEQIERTDSNRDVAVIMAASDDNPTLTVEQIEKQIEKLDDPDAVAIRRYGIFKQVSGRIFKDFNWKIHVIPEKKYFPQGMFNDREWRLARLIDYHQHNPWAIPWIALSPHNEAFVYWEWNVSPEKMVTEDIARRIAEESGDYRFYLNLIDPLADITQSNTNKSVTDDLNDHFRNLKNKEHIGTGGHWESWDTRDTKGRDAVRTRLKNALKVGKPYNNKIIEEGRTRYLPTLWILDTCPETAKSIRNWRLEEWADRTSQHTKERKEKPNQKYSHFCTAIEAIFKDIRWRPAPLMRPGEGFGAHKPVDRFQGARG